MVAPALTSPLLWYGQAISARTKRLGVNQVASLTLRRFLSELEMPQNPEWVQANFGQFIAQPFCIYADWPSDSHIMPVDPGDTLIRTDSVVSFAVTAGGTGYTTVPTVTVSKPDLSGETQATATATIGSGHVTAITINHKGSGYQNVPTVTITGGGGSNATATAALGDGLTYAIFGVRSRKAVMLKLYVQVLAGD